MSKEEFLKIQTCVLKVNIHCDGCKHKVKKILQKVEGVYTIKIDSEQGKVTVSGNVDPLKLIKKLDKSGKHAEIWGSKPSNNNQNQLNNQFKNMQIGHEKNAKNNNQKNGGGGSGAQAQPNNQQQLQKMKGFQDPKLPNLKNLNMPLKNQNQNNNQKGVKFNLPDDDDDMTDDEYDDDDDYDDDDEFEDDMHHHQPLNKMKNGPNLMMMNGMMNPQLMNPQLMNPQAKNVMMNPQLMNPQVKNGMMNPQLMNPQAKNGMMNPQLMNPQAKNGIPVNPINSKKGGSNAPIQMNGKGGDGNDNKGGNGGKKGGGGLNGNNNCGNQNPGGGSIKNGGKIGGGDAKIGNIGGGGNNKNGNNGGGGVNGTNINSNGAKKGGAPPMNNMPFGFQNMGQMSNNMNIPIGQMDQFGNMPRGVQLGGMQAVQGLPASAMNGGGNGGYFQGVGPGGMNGDPSYQHQLAAAMMNQQRAMGNERFHPMMYARPPPAVNYMPPYPHPHHPYLHQQLPHPPPGDSYTHMFSDENTSSCNVM